MKRGLIETGVRAARRLVIAVIGTTVLLFGLVLLFVPGPALIVIPIGLGILALEFEWARLWLRRAKSLYRVTSTASDPASSRHAERRRTEEDAEGRTPRGPEAS